MVRYVWLVIGWGSMEVIYSNRESFMFVFNVLYVWLIEVEIYVLLWWMGG